MTARRRRGVTPGPFIGRVLMNPSRIRDASHYAYALPALRGFASLDLHPAVTFFVGENGSGKSTLLEAIAVANRINPEGGSRNLNFRTRDSHSDLHHALVMRRYTGLVPDAWFLRGESFYNVASAIDDTGAEEYYGGSSLHARSHGEAFMDVVENRMDQGLYLMDEPESALSPQRQLELLIHLRRMIDQGSQLIIATHSPILMAYPDAAIYRFGDGGIEAVDYRETEHYLVTKTFLDNPDRMLGHLLGDR